MTLKTLTLTGLLAFCLPMAASQISSSLMDMAESHNEPKPIKPFSQIPAAMQIAQSNDMSTSICEYLGYKDYARIAQVSKLLRGMMHRCLYLQPRPLLLPETPKLIEYTKKLLENANDEGRLSAVKSLISLCERSYYPGQDLLNAFLQYRTDVPFTERICSIIKTSRLNNFRLVKKEDLLTDIADTHRMLEEQESALQEHKEKLAAANRGEDKRLIELREQCEATKERIERHKRILKTWQPYGLLLRLAMRYPCDHIIDLKTILETFPHNTVNIFAAPQICDTDPIINAEKRAFIASGACFLDGEYSFAQRIDALLPRLRYLEMRNQAADDCAMKAPGSLAELKRFKQEAIERLLLHASQAVCMDQYYLKIIDEITQHEYGIDRMLNHPNAWDDSSSNPDYVMQHVRYLKEIIDCVKENYQWHVSFRDCCLEIAEKYTDPRIKEIYYLKAAESMNNALQRPNSFHSRWAEPNWLGHIEPQAQRIDQGLAQNCSDPKELEKFRSQFRSKFRSIERRARIAWWLSAARYSLDLPSEIYTFLRGLLG